MNGVKVGAGAYRWATISIPWLVAPKTPITAMITQAPTDPGCFQTQGNIGVRNTRPAICVHASVVCGESAPASLRVASTYPRIADNARDSDKNDRLERARSWTRRDHHAEKSERDCDHPFRAHSFAEHRSRKKRDEDRREKRDCRGLRQLELRGPRTRSRSSNKRAGRSAIAVVLDASNEAWLAATEIATL